MRTWSISTTVRNPERIPNFLKAAEKLDGKDWNKSSQIEFFAQLICAREYQPTKSKLSSESLRLLENQDNLITFEQALKIIEEKHYVDTPMRGRTAISPLVDHGLVQIQNKISITTLGHALLNGKTSFAEVMMNFSLKWQVPQPNHNKFKIENGYAIRPFIGTLALIQKVNELWVKEGKTSRGLSWEEFCVFVPTLTNYSNILNWAKQIVEIRKKVDIEKNLSDKAKTLRNEFKKFLRPLLEDTEDIEEDSLFNNLKDYGDNAFRYFKQSKFIVLRGGGRFVDISPLSNSQVNMLIDDMEYKPLHFENSSDFLDYMQDLNSFIPPWSSPEKQKEIENKLLEILVRKGGTSNNTSKIKTLGTALHVLREDEKITKLREEITNLSLVNLAEEAKNPAFFESCINNFHRIKERKDINEIEILKINPATQLEYITFNTFLSINDLVEIKPNFPVDDEGKPIYTAGGNLPDLEVFYEEFNLICEVTLLTNRSQWMAESQPVQRHLYDFMQKHKGKETFAIFLAPIVHRDTKNSFKQAFHTGIDSIDQLNIIPFDFESWIGILNHIHKVKLLDKKISQKSLHSYFKSLLPINTFKETTDEWWNRITNSNLILEFIN